MKRRFDPTKPELMDRPQPVSAELEHDLRNLRQLNRLFGSHALVGDFVRRWIEPGMRVRIADLATGSGDIPRLVVDYARSIGAKVEIDALDQQAATLEIAKGLSADYPEITYHNANLLEWQPDEPYDIVHCSLALHHFSSADAVRVLRHARELSRRYVLIADLRRGLLATAGVYLLTALIFRDPMTRHDGRVSAARAFTYGEFLDLAAEAGWKGFGYGKFHFARQAIWIDEMNA
jgi:2-polyprenyl-3-methyl-5-hydroxy-6-metoxy-1,4-benzoquinol methylase